MVAAEDVAEAVEAVEAAEVAEGAEVALVAEAALAAEVADARSTLMPSANYVRACARSLWVQNDCPRTSSLASAAPLSSTMSRNGQI